MAPHLEYPAAAGSTSDAGACIWSSAFTSTAPNRRAPCYWLLGFQDAVEAPQDGATAEALPASEATAQAAVGAWSHPSKRPLAYQATGLSRRSNYSIALAKGGDGTFVYLNLPNPKFFGF